MEEGIKEGFPEDMVCKLNLQDQLSSKEDKAGECVPGKGKAWEENVAMSTELQVWLQAGAVVFKVWFLTSSIPIIWESVRNANPRPHPTTTY